MNTFIQILENENDVSIKKLKQIFRIISKKVHPDLQNGNNDSFIKLKNEYEEAYKIIEEGKYKQYPKLGKEEARIELLKNLYQFYLRVYSRKADMILNDMIRFAGMYDSQIQQTLIIYQSTMYKKHNEWKNDARTYYAHNVFLICIMQFFQCYNENTKLPERIFLGHRQAIEGWAENIKKEYKDILLQLYDWLKSELGNVHFEYHGI
jgi:curved DNA-binding protein CbpA